MTIVQHWIGCMFLVVLLICSGRTLADQCTVDQLLAIVKDVLPSGSVQVHDQFIGALRQVVKAIETAKGIPRHIRVNNFDLIGRIRTSLSEGRKGHLYGRTMLGFLLQRQPPCHPNSRRVVTKVKKALGEEKFKDLLAINGDVSLMFIIDTTGSMSQEIPQSRALSKSLNNYRNRGKVEYILSTFNDPECGPVRSFTNEEKRKFDSAIGRLNAFGGGDCHEPTFEGIINAIHDGLPYADSPMYVFTDSPSKIKGYRDSATAIALARDHNININFFFSRFGCANPLKDTKYQQTIDDTGGLGLFFPTPSSFYKARDILKADLDGTVIICSGSLSHDSHERKRRVVFPVDSTIARMIVSLNWVTNDSGVALLDSRGNILNNMVTMFEGLLWILDNPMAGLWTLVLNSGFQKVSYMVKGSSTSNIDFDHVFVRTAKPYNQQVRIPNPLQGERARAKVLIPNLLRLNQTSLQLHVVDKDGSTMSPLLYSDGEVTFNLPATNSFRLCLTGQTLDGDQFMRTSVNISPLPVILRTQILHDLLNIKRGRISYFRAMIDSSSDQAKVFRLIGVSFTRGIKLTMRRTIRVTKVRPGYIPVYVVTRYKVPAGTVAKILIIAISRDVTVKLIERVMVT